MVADYYLLDTNPRKVRAPWAKLPGNAWAQRFTAVTDSATENKPPRKG